MRYQERGGISDKERLKNSITKKFKPGMNCRKIQQILNQLQL